MARYATSCKVDLDEIIEFIRPRHQLILATKRADGRDQLSPVTAGVSQDGDVLVSTYPQRAKVRNLRRHGAASACVMSDDWNGAWVQIAGAAEILDLPDALETFVDYYRSISGEHPDWDEYRVAMLKQGKCLIRLHVDTWGPIATGGFPPELAGA